MTPEEAIIKLNGLYYEEESLNISGNMYLIALDMAKIALEKQIPKKPFIPFHDDTCPNCGYPFEYHRKYCPECGQKIDWSEEKTGNG